jgi:hypothetical protein
LVQLGWIYWPFLSSLSPPFSSVDIGIPTSHVMSVFCSVMLSRRDYSCLDCLVFDQNYKTLDDFFLGCVVDIGFLSAFALRWIVA